MANRIGESSIVRHLLAKRRANADWYYAGRAADSAIVIGAPALTRREVLRLSGAYKHLCLKRLHQADSMYYNTEACPAFVR